jgi:hypothetical protein
MEWPPEASWDAHVRVASAQMPGPCVLDLTVETNMLFSQGHFDLVMRDFELTLPSEATEKLRQVNL